MIEVGEIVKVKGKQGAFTVLNIIEDESGILGYHVRDKGLMNRFYRVNVVSLKKKKKTKRKSRKKSGST